MSKIKIGFVIPKYKSLQTKFNSGLGQNTYHLVSLFRSLPEYDVSYVLVNENGLQESLENQQKLDDDTTLVELKSLNPKLTNPLVYDVLIHVETCIPIDFIKVIKDRFSTKFVTFLAGIAMWGLMEDIIYDVKNRYVNIFPLYDAGLIDEQWISPHHAYHATYLETVTKFPVTIVPYIYEPWFLQKFEELRRKSNPNFNPRYIPNSDKHIGILEPNINLVKNLLIPACIVESLYCKNTEIFGHKTVRIYGSNHLCERQAFQHLFDYFKSKSLFSTEWRYPIVDILHYDCNLIISHQHLCALNYLYLDALYYNIPLVHNSDIIKDYGYYYPDFDVKKGAKALKYALENHDSHLEEYAELAQKALHRFSISNEKNINGYKNIIDSLLSR